MTSIGSLIADAIHDRIGTLLPAVPFYYRGEQSGDPEYILFLDDDERQWDEGSDKDGDANDYVVTLQLWSAKPRTNMSRAKTIIDSIESSPLSISGFYFNRSQVEQNQNMPKLTSEGQSNEYARIVRIRFYYHPTA